MSSEAVAIDWGFERYVARSVLGQGGMGTVYRAYDVERHEEVALKRLLLRADPEANRRRLLSFEREYHALSQLHHPAIIAAHDYGVDRLGAYYTMELLSGSSLHDRAHGERPVDWRMLCSWLRDVASALAMLQARRLVHRDVTPRNIHCLSDGSAKLLDFGALTSTDRVAAIVGTPPFLPPEAIAGRALDTRSDLFALGATAYWALTGRHAYPAKHIAELETLWRVAPPSLPRELPEALSELVLSLLSLDRAGRPSGPDEVMERLTAIAGLPPEDTRSVGIAYLVRPAYVGRNAQLREARSRALQAMRGRGSVLFTTGAQGSGRTRYLEECALEAKLLGMSVRELSSLAGGASHTARAIVEHARSSPNATLFIGDAVDGADAVALARSLEEAGLSHESALVVLATSLCDGAQRSDRHAIEIELSPINVLQARALLASMFGSGAGLESLAVTLQALSRGNVRALTELARELVVRGTLRCDAGTWLFPERIDEAELAGLARLALGVEVQHLQSASPSLRAGAYAIALDPERVLSHASLISVVPDLGGLSLPELRAQLAPFGVVLEAQPEHADAQRFRIADEAWARVLAAAVPDDVAQRIHIRLAEIAEHRSSHAQAIVHRCEAGDTDTATTILIGFAKLLLSGEAALEPGRPMSALVSALPRAVARCAAASRRAHRSQREQAIIDSMLFLVDPTAEYVSKDALRELGARLGRDSGLFDYARFEIEMPELPKQQHVHLALTTAIARHAAAAPGGDESAAFSPFEALHLLVRLAHSVSTIGVGTLDSEWLHILPSLAPYVELGAPLAIVNAVMRASTHVLAGRYLSARERYLEILQLTESLDRSGVDASGNRYTRLAVTHGIGFIEGQLGMPSALGYIAALHDDPHLAVSAWQLQGTYHFMQGDTDQANACRERGELLNASQGVSSHFPGTNIVAELMACGLADDLIGLKRAADRIASLAARYPGWRIVLTSAQIEYARARGDRATALELLRGMPLPELRARETPGWEILALAAARTLLASDRLDEAYEVARHLHLHALQHGMLALPISVTLALIEARRGDLGCAIARADATIRAAEELGCKGLPLGRAHELRATLAYLSGDATQLAASARACAEEYARGHNPALHALYQNLLGRARRAGFPLDQVSSVVHNDARATPEAVEAELNQSACEHELAERALSHVIARSGARDGFLYLRDLRASGGIRRVAARGAPSAAIDAHAQQVLASSVEENTVSVGGDYDHTRVTLGPEHETFVLGRDDIASVAVGVIVLVDSHRHGAAATLELLPALTRSCARRRFQGMCNHASDVGSS
jgi:hypothetical protein